MTDYKLVKAIKNGIEYEFPSGGGCCLVDVELVGGGGGKGYYTQYDTSNYRYSYSGGGGGGMVSCRGLPIVSSSTNVVVGLAGGQGSAQPSAGCNGGNSSFGDLVAHGGGGVYNSLATGGGGPGNGCSPTVAFEGFAGGGGASGKTGAGGGGAGGQGNGLNGGNGKQSFIDGKYYGAGAGGVIDYNTQTGTNGEGRGNAGSGGRQTPSLNPTNGIVLVRYPTDGSYGFTCATGGTMSTCTIDGVEYKIHCFVSDGTFCIVS